MSKVTVFPSKGDLPPVMFDSPPYQPSHNLSSFDTSAKKKAWIHITERYESTLHCSIVSKKFLWRERSD